MVTLHVDFKLKQFGFQIIILQMTYILTSPFDAQRAAQIVLPGLDHALGWIGKYHGCLNRILNVY